MIYHSIMSFRTVKSCSRNPIMDLEDGSTCVTSLFQLIIAFIMIGIGHSYSDDCYNGGTCSWLLLN